MFFRILKASLLMLFLVSFTIGAVEESLSFMKVLNHFQIVNPNIFIQDIANTTSTKIDLSSTNMLKKLFQNGQSGTLSFIDKWNFNSNHTV
jgi:hypothetical protein